MSELTTAELLDAIGPAPDKVALDPSREPRRRALLEAAAPLHLFRPSQLAVRVGASEPVAFIIDDIVPAVGWSAEGLWTLKNDVRKDTLARIARRALLAELRALNPKVPATPVQKMLDRWLAFEHLDLRRLAAAELSALRTLVEWGLGKFDGFPAPSLVEDAWRRRSLVAGFEQLAEGFVGRRHELAVLREFAGPGAGSPRGRCLMLHGLGGSGKSALVSRFILEAFDSFGDRSAKFVYLALDDQSLDPSRPATLMGAAVRQLDEQAGLADDFYVSFKAFRDERVVGERARRDFGSRGSLESSQRERLRKIGQSDAELNRIFADGIDRVARQGQSVAPFLFVIDTFEEASYRPETDLVLLYRMLHTLLVRVPSIRLLLIGRAPPPGADFEGLQAEELALGDLDYPDALSMLILKGFEPTLAEDAIRTFGSNPLTLRLLAHAVLETGIEVQRPLLANAGEEVIRGYLYRRILNHIHNPVVRRLAHPGMVLRRITPDIIQEVLAPICGVLVRNSVEAAKLFDDLAREHTLVGRDPDGSLVYREEIRRPMLKLIEADAPEQVEALHRAAANHYGRWDDDISREEELYHLLMLPDLPSSRVSRDRFPSRVAGQLAAVVDELPPASQVTLAQLTRVRIDPSAFDRAENADVDQIIARDVLYLLRANRFENALPLLQRPIEPGSPLGPLKVRVLRELGQLEEAEAFARKQVEGFPPLGNRARLGQLMWFAAQCSDDDRQTRWWLERLLPVARKLPRLTLIQTLTDLKRVAQPEDQKVLEEELARALAALSPSDANREDRLVRLALSRLGPRDPATWRALAPDLLYGLTRSLRARPSEEVDALGEPIADVLRDSSDPVIRDIVRALDYGAAGRWLERLISLLDSQLRAPEPNLPAVRAAYLLFSAERTSLSGASLAGLEQEDEEDWGPDAPSEALA